MSHRRNAPLSGNVILQNELVYVACTQRDKLLRVMVTVRRVSSELALEALGFMVFDST
jgi:hypothetical protein